MSGGKMSSSDGEKVIKNNKRVRYQISDSESSDSSSVVIKVNRKRKTQTICSDDSSSDDSDFPRTSRNRNTRALNIDDDDDGEISNSRRNSDSSSSSSCSSGLDSDWEDDGESNSEDEVESKKLTKNDTSSKSKKNKVSSDGESDQSDDQREKCPICLLSFRQQQVAIPSSCEHCFCLICLTEWSKNVNTCPVDRLSFTSMQIKNEFGGKIIKSVNVEPVNKNAEQVQEDPTYCEICHQCDREDRMLLCDGCDLGFHLECLSPPMEFVPHDEWFCPECSINNQAIAEAVEMDLDELPELMEEARNLGVTYGRIHGARVFSHDINLRLLSQRMIPRTRQSERVRANIRAGRNRVQQNVTTFDPDQPSTSSGIESISENSRGRSPNILQPSSSSSSSTRKSRNNTTKSKRRRKSTTKKKTNAKKRKSKKNSNSIIQEVRIREINADGVEEETVTYVKVSPRDTTTKKYKKRAKKSRKKYKNKRRKFRCRTLNTKTVKNRLSIALGLAKKSASINLTTPNLKSDITVSHRTSQLANARYRAGISQVDLFGNHLSLDFSPVGSEDDEMIEDGGFNSGPVVSINRRNGLLCSTRRRLALKGRITNPIRQSESQPYQSGIDLISSILNEQERWHSKNNKITLKADGTLLISDKKIIEREEEESRIEDNNLENLKDEILKKSLNNDNDSIIPEIENNLNRSTSINSSDIDQAPMYNNSRGGRIGNSNNNNSNNCSDNSGNSRGNNYQDRNYYNYNNSHDNYSGNNNRPCYGGSGGTNDYGHGDHRSQPLLPPPLMDFNYDNNRRRPPGPPPGLPPPHFRNRNHSNFRNEPRFRRFNIERGTFRPPQPNFNQGPVFPHPNNFQNDMNNINNPPDMSIPPPVNLNTLPPPPPPPPPPSSTSTSTSTLISTPASIPILINQSEIITNTLPITTTTATSNIIAITSTTTATTTTTTSSTTAIPPAMNESTSNEESLLSNQQSKETSSTNEECDIYDDIETFNDKSLSSEKNVSKDNCEKSENNSTTGALLPPPIPPSDLLDFEEIAKSDKDNESDDDDDDDDLVIDDSVKDTGGTELNDNKTEDKYDPFSVGDSDSNDSNGINKKSKRVNKKPDDDSNLIESGNGNNISISPLASPPNFPQISESEMNANALTRLGVYDDEDEDDTKSDCPNFSIYSSETMDVARHTEQELAQQIGPLEPPPLPPDIPDDDDVIVADVQACDLSDIPEPLDPYIQSLQKERQTMSKIPSKKITSDSRGKIVFKIGNKLKLNNKFNTFTDDLESNIDILSKQEKEAAKNKQSSSGVSSSVDLKQNKSEELSEKQLDISENIEQKSEDIQSVKKDDTNENIDEEKEIDDEINKPDEIDLEKSPDLNKFDNEMSTDSRLESSTPPLPIPKKSDAADTEKISEDSIGDKSPYEKSCCSSLNDADQDNDNLINYQKEDSMDHTSSLPKILEFELEKDSSTFIGSNNFCTKDETWDSDGGYTPCKDEMPVKDIEEPKKTHSIEKELFDDDLEPITPPPKDKPDDSLDKALLEYNELGTEAISETDEPINFDDTFSSPIHHREKRSDSEKGKSRRKSSRDRTKSDTYDHKSRRDKYEKSKDGEKNKENISSDNQVSWKKVSKNTKERSYREKSKRLDSRDKDKDRDRSRWREKSKDRLKKKEKEMNEKKKEKRKELPRYDVRKIVAEKPQRPRKDEYGRDIRNVSRSRSLLRTGKRSRSRSRSRTHSRSHSRSYLARNSRSWSRNRFSSTHKRSLSRSRRKLSRDKRSLSRRRSRSINRRIRRSPSPPRPRGRIEKRSLSRKRRSRSRSWSRSRSKSKSKSKSKSRSRSRSRTSKNRSRSRDIRKKDKVVKKMKSRSRSRRRKRTRSRTPMLRKTNKVQSKKRIKRKHVSTGNNPAIGIRSRSRSRERSLSRDLNCSRNWNKINGKGMERNSFIREDIDQAISAPTTSWSAQWTPSWSRSRSRSRSQSRTRTPTGLNRQRMMEPHCWSPESDSFVGLNAQAGSVMPPSSPPQSQSSIVLGSTNLGGIQSSGSAGVIDGIVSPKNLTVILRNKDALKSKKRKEKRSKEKKKLRDIERRKSSNKRIRSPIPSKEVFASGDNILVSVCFNNDKNNEQTTSSNNITTNINDTIPMLTSTASVSSTAIIKRRHRNDITSDITTSKKPKKDKSKESKRSKSPKFNKREKKRKSKAAEIAASKKPVAVIDLDQSPFREQTPSPRDIIVLSDDDNDNINDDNNLINNITTTAAASASAITTTTTTTTIATSNIINPNNNRDINNTNKNNELINDNNSKIINDSNNDHNEQQKNDKNQDENKDKQDHEQLKQHKLQQKHGSLLEHDMFSTAQGPKTPPEPQIKFSINKQSNSLRPVMLHPLFDADDEEMEEDNQEQSGTNVDNEKKDKSDRQVDGLKDNLEGSDNRDDKGGGKGDVDNNEMDNKLEENKQDNSKDNQTMRTDSSNINNNDSDDDNDDDDDDDEDDDDDDDDNDRDDLLEICGSETKESREMTRKEDMDMGLKIGPNTPPEPSSPYASPDAYDPFNPTKSRSPSPAGDSHDPIHCDNPNNSGMSKDSGLTTEKSESEKPKVISMVTIKHGVTPDKDVAAAAASIDRLLEAKKLFDKSLTKDQSLNQSLISSSGINSFTTINPVLATVAAAVQRSALFNNTVNLTGQRNSSQSNSYITPNNQLKQRTNDRSSFSTVKNLSLTSTRVPKSNSNKNTSIIEQNNDLTGDSNVIDTSSPYSPGSSLSDGIFDPPSPGRNHHTSPRSSPSVINPGINQLNNSNKKNTSDKKDPFDALFGSSPPNKSSGTPINKLRMKKVTEKRKKLPPPPSVSASNSKVGVRMDENQLQILDDLPSSAVEMQVKDKFLKKLNRQERVVEEVKLVLKPHYTKKHVTKEEYKDIMRKAVPKICHNRTGEINPKKIAQLIEAYVKRCRNNKRKGSNNTNNNPTNSTISKPLRPQRTHWS